MGGTLRGGTMGSGGFRRRGLWGGALLLATMVGMVVWACSNQSDQKGPGFPAGVVGTTDVGILVQVAINPNAVAVGRRAGVTIIVVNAQGEAVEGVHVQVSIAGTGVPLARLDRVDGFTDEDGKFVTFLLCLAAGDVTVTAFAREVSGTGTVTCGGGPAPTPSP